MVVQRLCVVLPLSKPEFEVQDACFLGVFFFLLMKAKIVISRFIFFLGLFFSRPNLMAVFHTFQHKSSFFSYLLHLNLVLFTTTTKYDRFTDLKHEIVIILKKKFGPSFEAILAYSRRQSFA